MLSTKVLENMGVTNMIINNDEFMLEVNGHSIRTKIDKTDSSISIINIRNDLK